MKATLSFQLPEEKGDFDVCQNAFSYLAVLEEFDRFLRAKMDQVDNEELDACRMKLMELAHRYDISF